jgi:hypothetical protein
MKWVAVRSILQDLGQELASRFVAGRFEDLSYRTKFEEAAFGEETDLVTDLAGEAHLVGDEDEVAAFGAKL